MKRALFVRFLALGAATATVVGVAAATSPAAAGQQLSRLSLQVTDASVASAWQLPDGLHLSGYGPERAGNMMAFSLDYSAESTRYPAGTHGRYGVVDLRTGRLRFFESSFDGGTTGVVIGGLDRFLRVENTGAMRDCLYGPGNCLPWAIVDTDPQTLESRVIDRGVTVNDSVMAPRPVAGRTSFAWQHSLPDGSNEIVEWRPGEAAPRVIGKARSQGELVDSAAGWLLATMWGRGPTLVDVVTGKAVVAPPLAGIVGGPGGLAWATQIPPTALDRPGTSDVYVGDVRDGQLVGQKIARVSDVYGLGWAGVRHVLIGTPLGVSLVPTAEGSLVTLPTVARFVARTDGESALIYARGDRGEIGVAVIKAT